MGRRRLKLMVGVVRLADRKLISLIFVTLVLSALAGAMQSLALKWLVDGALDQRWSLAVVAAVVGAVGAGLLGSAGRAMSDTELVVSNEVGLQVDRNTLQHTAEMPGIEHLERPEYLDRLALVRGGGSSLMRAVFTLTRTASLAISMVSSLWLLGLVHPLLMLTPICAIPTAVLVPKSERYVDRAKVVASERQRAATQLHRLFLAPGPAMELRVFGATDELDARSDQLWREVSAVQLGGAVRSALLASIGWLALTAGYVAALLFAAWLTIDGRATVGDIVLVSQLALLIRGNVAQTADAARRATAALHTADRFIWLEDLHKEQTEAYAGTASTPDRLTRGITLERLSFTYPGTDVEVLRDVDLHLPAGSTVAVVGANGAGKTTLVKLLAGMYRPTDGRVLIDDLDLATVDIEAWRHRMAGTFQDFVRLEAAAATSVGVGFPSGMDDRARVMDAVERGGASAVIDQLPEGLDSHLGKTYADGAELSGGQWQRLAIARGMMPEHPLCLVLDEPTAALDPAAEQALYEHYTAATSSGFANGVGGISANSDDGSEPDAVEPDRRGAVTVLISHRFSSVRMADTIVVLDRGTVVEHGTHEQLLTAGGHYAEMYRTQARAYE